MTTFTIDSKDLTVLKDNVVVLTGCASGIGLSTVELLLSLGTKIVGGDIAPPPASLKHPDFTFVKTDVMSWTALSTLFKTAKDLYGKIDHVFANAGISGRTTYLDENLDSNGELIEPNHLTIDINLKSVLNTSALAFHYMRNQESGGSVVVTASASSFQQFRVVDYATAKHGVLGFMRGMVPNFELSGIPIRINGIAPGWTATGLVRRDLFEAAGKKLQGPEVVARSVAILMADKQRQGEVIYSDEGAYTEIERGLLLKAVEPLFEEGNSEDVILGRVREAAGATPVNV